MKRLLLLLLILCVGLTHAQSWQWAKSAKGVGADEGMSVAADDSGNVFITGGFTSSSITLGTYTLSNLGGADIFIAKYNSSGNVLWAKRVGGSGDDYGWSTTTDGSGNVYVTGYYSSSITIGSYTLSNNGSNDIFVAKYNPLGIVQWVQHSGGTGGEGGYGVAADDLGNVYLTGTFTSSSLIFGTYTLSNSGGADIFIVKYNSSGNVLWAKSAGGTKDEVGLSITSDALGNVFTTGGFSSPKIGFGADTLINLGGPTTDNVFIVKHDSLGNVQWAKGAGGTYIDDGYSITTDIANNIYITGAFYLPITFGTYTLSNKGSNDVFLAKYNQSGTVIWARSAGGTGYDIGYSLSIDSLYNIYLSAGFDSPYIIYGTDTLNNPAVSGGDPMFILKYDSSGKALCSSVLASGGDDNNGIAADAFGNAYVGGDFAISPFIIGNDTLFLESGTPPIENIFIAKLNMNCTALSISEFPLQKTQINIYPNPTSDQFYIDTKTTDKLTIDLYDVNGRRVYSKNANDKSRIDVTNLNEGVYLLSIKTVDCVINKKLIILR